MKQAVQNLKSGEVSVQEVPPPRLHRGGALVWPENSPTAFRNTAALPVEQVEFDVHPTTDGRLAVFHDPTLERTSDGTGPVAAHS